MNTPNALLITQMGLQLATQLQAVLATQARANAEGRDVSDEEVAAARKGTEDALGELQGKIDRARGG